MKNLFLLMLCCLATGCATAPGPFSPSPPDYSGLHNAAPAERPALYQKLGISQTQGLYGKLGGYWCDMPSLKEACAQISAKEARHDFGQAFAMKIFRNALPPVTLLVGAGLGYYWGVLNGLSSGYIGGYRDLGRDSAIGAGVGAVLALVEWPLLDHAINKDMANGAVAYNARLREALQINVMPTSGGGKAGVNVRF